MSSWTLLESALAQSLLGALWQDAVLAALAALVLAAMARLTAAARHTVGLLFLLAMAGLPAWHLAQLLGGGAPADTVAPPAVAAGFSAAPAAMAWLGADTAPAWLAWAWCGGVLVMLARLGGGWWLLRALERQPQQAPVPARWQRRVDALCQALGIHRPVALRLLRGAGQPFSARAWRPVVWLPLALLTHLPPDMVEALIAHELAHIRRLDWVWNGLQCAVETLLFFHPGVWWLSRRVRIEREHACDDLAAVVCGDPLVVAEALASLAHSRAAVPLLALAAGRGSLVRRVHRLLAAGRPAAPRWGVVAGLLGLVCAGAVVAAQMAQGAQGAASAQAVPSAGMPAAPVAPAAVSPAAAADTPDDPWWTQFGDSVRIRIRDGGHLRDYHAWAGLGGDAHETYRVDGHAAPIDAEVRQWVAAHHAPPTPPTPPDPPAAPPVPPLPPLPPMPEAPPPLSESPAYQALLQAVQQDASATAALGTPIRLAEDCGPCRLDDDAALLTLSARGPKGRATVRAQVRRVDGHWQMQSLSLRPAGGAGTAPTP